MKKLLVGLLALGSISAFSFHVEESDKFINVGRIESFKLVKSLNIKPNTYSTKLGRCRLKHNKVNFDRSLTAPKKFIYEYTKTLQTSTRYKNGSPYGDMTIFFFGLKSASQIECSGVYYGNITIKDMREMLKGYIEFKLSEPVEMD